MKLTGVKSWSLETAHSRDVNSHARRGVTTGRWINPLIPLLQV